MDTPAAPRSKIAKDKQFRERLHGLDGAGKAAETAGDNHPGPHGLGSGTPFPANIYGLSCHECVPTAWDDVAHIVSASRQNPERQRSRGVNRDVTGTCNAYD